ncbi:MAG: hypothetical protein ACR2H3_03180 [Acidimicrobiales bacterium]
MSFAPRIRAVVVALCGLPFLAAVVLMASRVGETARFVTWPVVAFTALAGAIALVGLWAGLPQPGLLALGAVPALAVSYVLPAMPFLFIAFVLAGLGVLAVKVRGVGAGMATVTGSLMVLSVVLQGPAVECGQSSVSGGDGPWWIASPSRSSGSGSTSADGITSGTTQVGEWRYVYGCEDGRLTRFERVGGGTFG